MGEEEMVFKANYKLPARENIPVIDSDSFLASQCHELKLSSSQFFELKGTNEGRNSPFQCFCCRPGEDCLLVCVCPIVETKDVTLTASVQYGNSKVAFGEFDSGKNGEYSLAYTAAARLPPGAKFENWTLSLEAQFSQSSFSCFTIACKDEIDQARLLSKDLQNLLLNKEYADVCFDVQGEKFWAHKIVVTARSEYFSKELSSGMIESKTNRVEITDCDPKIFRGILDFIYCGRTPKLFPDALNTLLVAYKYQITALFRACFECVQRNTSPANVEDVLEIASTLNNEELRNVCFGVLMEMSEPDRWKILYNLKDDDVVAKFLKTMNA